MSVELVFTTTIDIASAPEAYTPGYFGTYRVNGQEIPIVVLEATMVDPDHYRMRVAVLDEIMWRSAVGDVATPESHPEAPWEWGL